MKYTHTETVDAFAITGVAYTLDDGTTKTLTTPAEVGSYFVIDAAGAETVQHRDAFEARYTPLH